jgi:hypothetical protein
MPHPVRKARLSGAVLTRNRPATPHPVLCNPVCATQYYV